MSNPVHDRITTLVTSNDVVLFMKGTPFFPQCGFFLDGDPDPRTPRRRL